MPEAVSAASTDAGLLFAGGVGDIVGVISMQAVISVQEQRGQ
jgi:hypothetical protein